MEVSALASTFNTLNIGALSAKHFIVTTNHNQLTIYNFTDDECFYYIAEGQIDSFKFFLVGDFLYMIYSIDVECHTTIVVFSLIGQNLILTAKKTYNLMWVDFFYSAGYLVNIGICSSGYYYDLMDLNLSLVFCETFPCSDHIVHANGKYYALLEDNPIEITVKDERLRFLDIVEDHLVLNIPPIYGNQLFVRVLDTNYFQNYAGDIFSDGYMISTGMNVMIGSKFVKFKFENLYVVSESESFMADSVINSIVGGNIYYIDTSNEENLTINSIRKSITSLASDRGIVKVWVPE